MLRSAVRRWVRVATTSMRTAALVPSCAQNASALWISWPRRRNTSWQQLFVPTLAESCEEHMQSPRRSDARPLRRNCRGHLVRLEATAASTWEPCARRMKNISNGTLAWSEVRVRDVSSCPGDASWSVLPRPLLGSCGCARGPPSLGDHGHLVVASVLLRTGALGCARRAKGVLRVQNAIKFAAVAGQSGGGTKYAAHWAFVTVGLPRS